MQHLIDGAVRGVSVSESNRSVPRIRQIVEKEHFAPVEDVQIRRECSLVQFCPRTPAEMSTRSRGAK